MAGGVPDSIQVRMDAEVARVNAANAAKDAAEEPPDWQPWQSQPEITPFGTPNTVAPTGRAVVGGYPGSEQINLHSDPRFVYVGGDGAKYWDMYAPETRARLEGQLERAGLLNPGGYQAGALNETQHVAWEQVMGYANYYGVTPFNAIKRLENEYVATGGGRGRGGGGARGPVIEIPDYPTIAQNSKNMLKNTVGRDVEDWEIAMVGAEMQKQYRSWASLQEQKQLSGGGVYEVNDPNTMTQAFVDDQYGAEVERMGAMTEDKQNHALVLDVLTKGSKMVGT